MKHLSNTTNCNGARYRHRTVKSHSGDARRRVLTVLIPAAFSSVATLSQAQTSAGGATQQQQTEEVVISASRIARSGFTAPTPTTTLGVEDREVRASTTVADLLFDLPSVRPAAPSLQSQNTGLQAINLRGLGNNRTLLLVDGRRFVPTTITGVVDSNVVPNALIERVEVVTGGASAAWGSDAVAGVVNFIFKKHIEGVQGEVQYGESQRGDNKSTSASLAWGTDFADGRGQFMVSGEYNTLRDRQKFSDREWSNRRTGFVAGTINGANITRIQVDGLTLSGLTTGGVVVAAGGGPLAVTSPLRGIQFAPGGNSVPFNYGANVNNTTMIGGDGGWFQDSLYISAPLERKSLYTRGTFDFTEHVRGYAEASVMESSSKVPTFPVYNPNGDATITIQRDNGYLQTLPALASLRATLAANPTLTSFSVGRINTELGRNIYETNNQTKRAVAGFDGDLAGWQWKAYYTHGVTDYDAKISDHLIEPNWRAAVDTVVENGQIICRVNSTTAANIAIVNAATYAGRGAAPGCVPANIFGAGSVASNVKDYAVGTQSFNAKYKQDAVGAQIQGEPLSTWAGKVSIATGIEYRKESVTGDSDSISKLSNPVYLIGGFQYGNPKPISGSYDVMEYFAETVVPLASKQPWAKSLDLNAAVRRTDYSTSATSTRGKSVLLTSRSKAFCCVRPNHATFALPI